MAAPIATKPPATPASSHTGAVKSGWTVQVGSFARRDYAERMAKQVTAKGYAVEVAGRVALLASSALRPLPADTERNEGLGRSARRGGLHRDAGLKCEQAPQTMTHT